MQAPLLLLLLGFVLVVLGVYMMTIGHRKNSKGKIINSRKRSVLWSFLEMIFDIIIGIFTGGPTFDLGSAGAFMFIVGILMLLINFLGLIHSGSVQFYP